MAHSVPLNEAHMRTFDTNGILSHLYYYQHSLPMEWARSRLSHVSTWLFEGVIEGVIEGLIEGVTEA